MKRILVVADERGWVFDRHAQELKKRLTDFHVDIAYRRNDIKSKSQSFDITYIMDPMAMRSWPDPKKTIMGFRNEFMYLKHPEGVKGMYEKGLPGYGVDVKTKCSMLHVVNKRQIEAFRPVVGGDMPLLLVRHGVDENIFNKNKYAIRPQEGLVVSAAGRNSRNKGFGHIVEACKKANVNCITAQYGGKKRTKEQMPEYYAQANVHVCFSKNEGLNNPIIEAGAMGLVPVSTRAGAAEEMIEDGVNGFLIDRNVHHLKDRLNELKDEDLRLEMGERFYQEVMDNWTWKVKIEEYRNMFKEFLCL